MQVIDRDTLTNKAEILYQHTESGKIIPWSAVRVCEINNIKTVDAEPVRHAYWYDSEFDGFAGCSHCHKEVTSEEFPPTYDYCPHCGAKMDLEV